VRWYRRSVASKGSPFTPAGTGDHPARRGGVLEVNLRLGDQMSDVALVATVRWVRMVWGVEWWDFTTFACIFIKPSLCG